MIMATIGSVNIDRIEWCLNDRQTTIEELAAETGIEPEKIRSVLHGNERLSLGQLKSIAKFFNRGLLFFVAKGDVKEERLRTAGFRTLANDYPKVDPEIKSLMERVERQRQILINLKEELGEDEPLEFRPPHLPSNNLKEAAAASRRWLSLNGECSFVDYRRAIESKGALVFLSNGYLGPWRIPPESKIAGFSIFHQNLPIILVRKDDAPARQLFTLIHELAHLLIHSRGSIDTEDNFYATSGKERAANAFAGYFLVPDNFLLEIEDRVRPTSPDQFDSWLRAPSVRWGVSVEVILRRLLDSDRLTRNEYQAYRTWKSTQVLPVRSGGSRQNRHREPLHIFGRPFVATVLNALGARQLTATKASRFLDNIKIKDIHKLEREFNAL